jgi:hypothetical protein
MKIRLLLLIAALGSFVAVPSGSAVPPLVMGDAGLAVVSGNELLPIPAHAPQIGDTIESTWATFSCDPGCDPTEPDADPTVGNRTVHPSAFGPPVGISMAWERCSSTATSSCSVVRPRSFERSANRYLVTEADAGFMIRSAAYATNLDCGFPRSYDQHQDCRYEMRGVYSKLTPRIPDLPTVEIAPLLAPDGAVGQPYSLALTPSHGTAPHSFSIVDGTLPAGLALSPAGTLSGTPVLGGAYTFTVRAGAAGARAGQRTYTVRIQLALSAATLASGTTGVAYAQNLPVPAGSTAPVTWKVVSGTVPAGLALGPEGAVSGTPTQAGAFAFTAEASDAVGATGTATYTVAVGHPTLALAPLRLPDARIRARYIHRFLPTGGSAPYTFRLTGGKLPRGLTLTAAGVLTGTPRAAAGLYPLRVGIRDLYGADREFALSLRVKPAKIAKRRR